MKCDTLAGQDSHVWHKTLKYIYIYTLYILSLVVVFGPFGHILCFGPFVDSFMVSGALTSVCLPRVLFPS